MTYDITVNTKGDTDQIGMINDYLNAVNQETHVENPTISTANSFGDIAETMTSAPGNIDLTGLRVTDDLPSIQSAGTVESHGNEPKVDLGDDNHNGIPNYLDAEGTDTEAFIDSDKDGIADKFDVTGSASNVDQSQDIKGTSEERVRSSLTSAIMTLLQFDFSLALGGADPSENEANKIGALAQTSLGIIANRDAKVQDIDNSRNVSQEMKQHKVRTNKLKLKLLEKTVLTGTRPLASTEKT
ncbi:MAG: hypothetical protein LBI37_01990 [Puniceicoccales bacterium]|jgi:hypothetical protein|nr:hypothetical protein [Puniceicoccales bacterium]